MTQPVKSDPVFDAAQYWRKRHENFEGLVATGTLGAPATWQRWLYRGKVRAYVRAFDACGISVQGARVLDFGCGSGYFEDVWESLGAEYTAGIDLVEDVIETLRAVHPHRAYRAGDLAGNPALADDLGWFDVVTAIDVLYHIVDDRALERVIANLAQRLTETGSLLLTDALIQCEPARHVKFRPLRFWKEVLATNGLYVVHREPVFILQNRPGLVTRLAPSLAGALTYWADLPLGRLFPMSANNFALVCKRHSA
jgi:2-polyprenyl-3-methyl-5-hydroxy-6-metoxy-1,4-benzoquinol methylase